MLVVSCLRVLVLIALVQSEAGALRAAMAGAAATEGADLEAGGGAAAASAGADGRVNPVMLQMQLLGRELNERDYGALLALDENGGGGAPRRGVPRAAVEQMPTHVFRPAAAEAAGGAAAGGAGGLTCAVCLEDAAQGDAIRTLPCMHQVTRARSFRPACCCADCAWPAVPRRVHRPVARVVRLVPRLQEPPAAAHAVRGDGRRLHRSPVAA